MLPGSTFLQNCIAYGTGFLGPTYFPYYVYSSFGLHQMRFHVVKGVSLFLVLPYILFVTIYAITGQIQAAQYLLVIPVFYAIWVITSLIKSINVKYGNEMDGHAIVEMIILILSLFPWVFLPIIDIFNGGQAIEVLAMNSGFLLLLVYQIKQSFELLRNEHYKIANILTTDNKVNTLATNGNGNLSLDTYNLTKREREIASLIAHGRSYKQIAETLYISERTVKKHIEHIFEKVKVNSKFELIAKVNNSPQAQSEQ